MSQFNIIINILNSKFIHSSLAPWCLLAGIRKYCRMPVSAKVKENTINQNISDIAGGLISENPQVIGFSCYIWNITQTLEIVHIVKKALPECKIVLGGPEVSYNAHDVLAENPDVDFIISGEGELPFARLSDCIYSKTDNFEIPGLCYRNGSDIVVSEPYTPDDEPPSPYTPEYLANLNGRIAYLETSRGCPFRCAFCLSGRCGNVRFFDFEQALQNMLTLANSGAKTIKLIDRTFNANRERAYRIFKFIIDNHGTKIPNGVCFHFEIAGDILDERTIALLASAPIGSIQLEIGLQSFNAETLSAVHRRTDMDKLYSNIQALLAPKNIHIHIDLIAGLPYEDVPTFAESFNKAYNLRPNMLQMGFLKLLHGADMRECPSEFPCEYSEIPPYEVQSTPWLSEKDMAVLHNVEDCLERIYNSGRFLHTIEYILSSSAKSPFDVFLSLGEYMSDKNSLNMPLDEFVAHILACFSAYPGVDRQTLRDKLVTDRLSVNSSGKLPKCLQITDTLLKKAKFSLERLFPSSSSIKRGIAILYSEKSVIFADYDQSLKNPITGEYPTTKIPLSMFNF